MSAGREKFLAAIESAESVVEGTALVDMTVEEAEEASVDRALHNTGLRFMRNGIAIALFAALEDFVWDRSKEIAAVLSSASIAREQFPPQMIDDVEQQSVAVLQSVFGTSDPRNIKVSIYEDLANAWNPNGFGAWSIPHAAFVWTGSNMKEGDLLRPLKALGAAQKWNDLSGVLSLIQPESKRGEGLPTKTQFEELARIRHRAAHDASFDATLLELRNKPGKVREFAFCFDSLIAMAANSYKQAGQCERSGRDLVDLVRFERLHKGTSISYREMTGPYVEGKKASKKLDESGVGRRMNEVAAKGKVAVKLKRDASGRALIESWVTPL